LLVAEGTSAPKKSDMVLHSAALWATEDDTVDAAGKAAERPLSDHRGNRDRSISPLCRT
jgi:hypothetical protein